MALIDEIEATGRVSSAAKQAVAISLTPTPESDISRSKEEASAEPADPKPATASETTLKNAADEHEITLVQAHRDRPFSLSGSKVVYLYSVLLCKFFTFVQ
jgi:hypothetical protein